LAELETSEIIAITRFQTSLISCDGMQWNFNTHENSQA